MGHLLSTAYLPWVSDDGRTLLVKTYYNENAAETIISPNDIVITHYTNYGAWCQYSNVDTGQGYIEFQTRDDGDNIRFSLTATNGLWYYYPTNDNTYHPWYNGTPITQKLTVAAQYQL